MPSVAFQGYRDDGLRLVTGNRACEVCSVGFTARSHARTCSPRRRRGEDDDESGPIGHADPSFRPQRRYPPALPGLRSNWRATIPPLMSATQRESRNQRRSLAVKRVAHHGGGVHGGENAVDEGCSDAE